MAEGFSDASNAARMREVMRRLAIDVLNEEQPPYKYGTVESINPDNRSCRVVMSGDSTSVPVKILGVQPVASGQVVQVSGRRGDKFISGVIGRSINVDVTEADLGTPTLTLGGGIHQVTADWSAVADAHHYEVQFANDSAFTDTVRVFDTISVQFTLNNLTAGTTIYARVRARNGSGGAGPWSLTQSAVVDDVPDTGGSDGAAPTASPDPVITPGLGYLLAEWLPISNPDPVTYEVHVGTTSGFTPGSTTKVGETGGTFFFIKRDSAGASLAYDTTYFVRIIAKDADGAAPASAQGSGQIDRVETGDVGDIPSNEISDGVAPASSPDVTDVHNGVGFLYAQWNHISNPDGAIYEVHVSDTSGFVPDSNTLVGDTPSNRFFIRNQGPGSVPANAPLEYGVTYYIKIWAKDNDGYAPGPGAQGSGVVVRVATGDMEAQAVTWEQLAPASVRSAMLDDGAVTEVKIGDDAITAPKIKAGEITSSHITVVGLDAGVIKTGTLDAGRVTVGAGSTYEGGYDPTTKATPEYVQSRGENLVTNGSGLLGDNTNFSGFDFNSADKVAGGGSFEVYSASITRFSDEYIPVDPNTLYRLSGYLKNQGAEQGRFYFGFSCYDADRNYISTYHVAYTAGTQTTLAQALTPGDTTVVLTDSANWRDNVGAGSHYHSIALYPYTDGQGFTYDDYTYTRHYEAGIWDDLAIDRTTHTITLNRAFNVPNPDDPNGVWPAGTPVTNNHSGGGYNYNAAANALAPADWTLYSGEIDGLAPPGTYPYNQLRQGTAFVRLLFLLNRNTTAATTTGVSVLALQSDPEGAVRRDYGHPNDVTLIDGGRIFTDSVTADAIAANQISATHMIAGTITAASGIIADAAIDRAKIIDGEITTAKIADLNVTRAKIDNLAVNTAQIADAAIATAKIGNLQVTDAKISTLSVAKLTAGTMRVGAYIQSDNYVAGSSGFHLHANGTAEFSTKITTGGSVVMGEYQPGHYGISLDGSHSNIFMRRESDGNIYFRINYGGATSMYALYDNTANSMSLVIKGGSITASTITGSSFTTGSSGARWEISGANVYGYTGSGSETSPGGLTVSDSGGIGFTYVKSPEYNGRRATLELFSHNNSYSRTTVFICRANENIFTGNVVTIMGGNPHIELQDNNLTGSGKSYFIYQNQGTFYILMDRTGNGGWNSPHPCYYNGSNWVFSGNLSSDTLTSSGNFFVGGNVVQISGGGHIYWQTPSGGSSGNMYVRTHYKDQALAFVGGDMRSVNYGNSAWKNMAANAFNTPSDSIIKSDMSRFTRAEDVVLAAPVWAYTMHGSTDNRRRLGVVAADLPEYLTAPDHEWGTEGIDLYNMISILWAAVREQGKRLARLEGRSVVDPDVERLKAQIRERLSHDGPVPYAYENLSGEHTRDMNRIHEAAARQAEDRARYKHVPVPRTVRMNPESRAIVGMNPPAKTKR